MICINTISKYCCEDISLIENYDKAINDTTQTWHCHHRLEIEFSLSQKQMKERGIFYNRPACELIFLTKGEHIALHNKQRKGEKNPLYNTHRSVETKIKIGKTRKGEKHPLYGKKFRFINNGIKNTMIELGKIDDYLKDGWKLGKCKKQKSKE